MRKIRKNHANHYPLPTRIKPRSNALHLAHNQIVNTQLLSLLPHYSATLGLLPRPRCVSLKPYFARVGSTHVRGGGCGVHSSGGTRRWRYFSGWSMTTGGANSSICCGVLRLSCFVSPSNQTPAKLKYKFNNGDKRSLKGSESIFKRLL